jgi:hypothetical protein
MHFAAKVRLDDACDGSFGEYDIQEAQQASSNRTDVHRLEDRVADLHLRFGDVRAHTLTLGVLLTRQIHLVARAALGRAHKTMFQQEREAVSNEGSVARVSLSPCTGKSSDNHLV